MNQLRIVILLATATAWACGGDDNATDSGSDATSETGGGDAANDVTSSDVANDTTGNDGGGTDGSATDAGDAGFACGTTTCDSKTQYCQKAQKGLDGGLPDAAKNDAGNVEVDTCLAYPQSCTADGGTPSCTCISTSCTCAQSGSDITVTCP